MRRRVPDDLQARRILRRDDGQPGIRFDDMGGIDELVVDPSGERRARQPAPMDEATSATETGRSNAF
jgi:hypothetical protein